MYSTYIPVASGYSMHQSGGEDIIGRYHALSYDIECKVPIFLLYSSDRMPNAWTTHSEFETREPPGGCSHQRCDVTLSTLQQSDCTSCSLPRALRTRLI